MQYPQCRLLHSDSPSLKPGVFDRQGNSKASEGVVQRRIGSPSTSQRLKEIMQSVIVAASVATGHSLGPHSIASSAIVETHFKHAGFQPSFKRAPVPDNADRALAAARVEHFKPQAGAAA